MKNLKLNDMPTQPDFFTKCLAAITVFIFITLCIILTLWCLRSLELI